ncbi:hypothetical protein M430DRAFT_224244 [Amorphotheca resinae ATCC 22711]|uniref:Uncharacterized protein n=1 Tax=Amorphotheca resinae ATCC 22711 TaxID=857342 RepID=A0A2T3B6H9_AMORE|nr:hypothetical protein M430DRAFT_224244 [Amorphotheca resinae ATCC 22711]PSS22338.1 hypothetical protein M430DRAFT_224244 [Amorphotheca resinae ATCC 22711]
MIEYTNLHSCLRELRWTKAFSGARQLGEGYLWIYYSNISTPSRWHKVKLYQRIIPYTICTADFPHSKHRHPGILATNTLRVCFSPDTLPPPPPFSLSPSFSIMYLKKQKSDLVEHIRKYNLPQFQRLPPWSPTSRGRKENGREGQDSFETPGRHTYIPFYSKQPPSKRPECFYRHGVSDTSRQIINRRV